MAALAHGAGDEGLETRDRILQAAGATLARFGLSKLTLEDVARAAGVTRQSIYRYFSGKDDLIMELFVAEMEQTHYPVLRDVAKGKPSAETLVRLVLKEIELARGYALYDDLLAPGAVARMAELTFGSEKFTGACEALWVPILERYEQARVVRPGLDHRAITRWLIYQQFWLVTHPTVLTDDPKTVEMYVRECIVGALVTR
jgi:AcrR family transcriptional regulator